MSARDYLNLSVDMRRIAWWLQNGSTTLADDFIKLTRDKFGSDESLVEGRKLSEWITRVENHRVRGWKSAEDALTLSVLLKNRFSL